MRPREKNYSPFTKRALKVMKSIPLGSVITYGFVARLAGNPRGARQINWLLSSCGRTHKLPWQRIIGAKGKIAFSQDSEYFVRQCRLLKKEGIEIHHGRIDLNKFLWKRAKPFLAAKKVNTSIRHRGH